MQQGYEVHFLNKQTITAALNNFIRKALQVTSDFLFTFVPKAHRQPVWLKYI